MHQKQFELTKMDRKNVEQSASTSNEKSDKGDSKKYNFYRKPSIKKKAPEVKQTLTSYKRMLKANPLLKYEMEGKDLSLLSKHLQSSGNGHIKSDNACSKNFRSEKMSLQPNLNVGKPLIADVKKSQSRKRPPNLSSVPTKKEGTSIISGSKQFIGKNIRPTNISRQSNVVFNTSASKFLCSTRLDNGNSITQFTKSNPGNCNKTANDKDSLTRDRSISSSDKSTLATRRNKLNKNKPMRRSLSAQHFDRKKDKADQHSSFTRVELTQSLEDMSKSNPSATLQREISPIAEGSHESSIIFKTPSAYERRSILKSTPKSVLCNRRSIYRPVSPLPTLYDLQKRLNDWLLKRGKGISYFHHLKCFGIQDGERNIIDEENKENIEIDQDLDKGSYEDLKITITNCDRSSETVSPESLILTDENAERIAKAALEDLHKLIQDGYPRAQCEGWLELIRQKYKNLEEEPQYWECRAAIEQSRGNISNAVQCYRTAIVQGAEIQSVDESLDILLQKFSLLNISPKDVDNERFIKERARIVKDARNVFKSSIIQFAVQERRLKKDDKKEKEKKFIATPVRRSTRLSRSAYTSTPGVKMCSSLQELEQSDRDILDFKKNKALL